MLYGGSPSVADAEIGYSLTLSSDDRFRGATTSDHLPVGTLSVSYDDKSGLYAGGSATVGPVHGAAPRVLGAVQYIGYVRRVSSGMSVDAGVSSRMYDRRATVEYARRFAQLYLGLVGRRVSSHAFYAPNYDGHGNPATYVQVDTVLFEQGRLTLTGHLGALRPPRGERYGRLLECDWRLSVARRVGNRSTISMSWVGGGPEIDDDRPGRRWRGAIVFAATRTF